MSFWNLLGKRCVIKMHIFKNCLKVMFRTKALVFWTLCFPLILATLFSLAFSNINSLDQFDPISVGIVEKDSFPSSFQTVIDELSKKSDNQLLKLTSYSSVEKAKEDLKNGTISGYYQKEDSIRLIVKENGMNSTILKQILDEYQQNASVITNLIKDDPVGWSEKMTHLFDKESYFVDASSKPLDYVVVYFYSLLGMVCLYGGFFGIQSVVSSEANLSWKGARVSIAPTNKWSVLIPSLLAALLVLFVESLLILAYLILVLKVDFGANLFLVILMLLVGDLAGISLGTLIGVSNRKDENAKTAILLSITMTASFLAGLMLDSMKYLVATYVPFLAKINPVAMITDGFYALSYSESLSRYTFDIVSLLLFSIVMMVGSYLFLRRKQYDSI